MVGLDKTTDRMVSNLSSKVSGDKIAGLKLKGRAFLAPMAGVNDLAFRQMCHDYGSALNFTEMVSVNAVERKNKAVIDFARTLPNEGPVCVQLFGTRISAVKKTIAILDNDFPDISSPSMYDFNFGCPVRKIMDQGAGSALLRRPSRMAEIIKAMRSATDKPISAKIRLGIKPGIADYLSTAKLLEEAGADMLTVHARYQVQGYSGKAEWNAIAQIKRHVLIPVVGNGDVVNEESAKKMMDETGCDYVMVGRAAMGNPFIFKRINDFLSNGENTTQKSKVDLFLEYLKLAKKFDIKQRLIKDQAMYFTRGMKNSSYMRDSIRRCKTPEEIKEGFMHHSKDFQ